MEIVFICTPITKFDIIFIIFIVCTYYIYCECIIVKVQTVFYSVLAVLGKFEVERLYVLFPMYSWSQGTGFFFVSLTNYQESWGSKSIQKSLVFILLIFKNKLYSFNPPELNIFPYASSQLLCIHSLIL